MRRITVFPSRKALFQAIDDSLSRLGMDYVDLYQIHRFDHSTPVEETMEALHDIVKAGQSAVYRRFIDGGMAVCQNAAYRG